MPSTSRRISSRSVLTLPHERAGAHAGAGYRAGGRVRLHPSAHGGVLRKRRAGRGARRVSTRYSMHLVLRSSQARGEWSLARPEHRLMIDRVLAKHAARFHVHLLGTGNAGNHLHIRAQFSRRKLYIKFIRAVTGEIALKIKRSARATRASRAVWAVQAAHSVGNKTIHHGRSTPTQSRSFWDHRPFSSIVAGARYVARLTDYIKINHLEGHGFPRAFCRLVVKKWREGSAPEFYGGVYVVDS